MQCMASLASFSFFNLIHLFPTNGHFVRTRLPSLYLSLFHPTTKAKRRSSNRRMLRSSTCIGSPVHAAALLLLMILVASSSSRSSGGSRSSTNTWNSFLPSIGGVEAAVVYALYNVPSFRLTFQTQPTDELMSSVDSSTSTGAGGTASSTLLSQTNGKDSGLSFPLRSVTQSFLYQELLPYISQLEEDTKQAQNPQYVWYDMYAAFVGMDLSVSLYLERAGSTNSDSEEDIRRSRRSLVQTVSLRAELHGTLAFEEPDSSGSSGKSKPSNEQVYQMFGQWMQTIFATQRDAYLRELVQSNQDLLRGISSLEITMTTAGSSGSGGGGSNNNNSSSSTYATSWSERTEKALFTILILVCVVGFGWTTLAVRQRIRRKYMMNGGGNNMEYVDDGDLRLDGNDNESDDYNFNSTSVSRPPAVTGKDRSTSMDAVRHGTDIFHRSSVSGAMSVLENTDRYLSKHRPDLYNGGQDPSFQVFGREYSIPANPFEYIYSAFSSSNHATVDTNMTPRSGSFMVSPQGAFSAPSQNLAAIPFDEEEDMMMEGDPSLTIPHKQRQQHQQQQQQQQHYQMPNQPMGYRPISSIWRNITNMWDHDGSNNHNGMRPHSSADGIILQTPQGSMDMNSNNHHYHDHNYDPNGLELQTVHFYDQDEEDPADYNFAFKDFPRHDGTPCLIFNENQHDQLTPKQREIFEIGDHYDSFDHATNATPVSSISVSQTTPVSNDAFARMLAEQARHSPDGTASFIDSDSVFCDEPSVLSSSSEYNGSTSTMSAMQSPEFKEQLGRLMQQKHRQYEKKAIVEKHQERREKERKILREQERRDKHKEMERHIEDLESAFSPPPAAAVAVSSSSATAPASGNHSPKPSTNSSRWASSPNPYGTTTSSSYHQQASPSYRQGYSPYRNGGRTSTGGNSASSPTNNSRARPSPSRGSLARSNSYDRADHHYGVPSSSSPQPTLSPHMMMDEKSDHVPFRMRPRTSATTTTANDLFSETTTSSLAHEHYRRGEQQQQQQQHPYDQHHADNGGYSNSASGGMDYSTLDRLSMPPMTIDGSTNNWSTNGMNKNWATTSLNSTGTTKKYSPNSALTDLFLGAPTSISRRKGSFGSTGGSSVASQPQTAPLSQQQPRPSLHRRVSSLDHKDSIGSTATSSANGPGWERPLPQQRRGRGSKKLQQQPSANNPRALTPTRQDVRTTLNGGLRSSTPSRGIVGTMPVRPLTPMSHYSQQQRGGGGESSSVSGGSGAFRSGSNPRSSMQQSSSSSSLSSRGRRGHSPSNSLSTEDPMFTHGISSVTQTRFV